MAQLKKGKVTKSSSMPKAAPAAGDTAAVDAYMKKLEHPLKVEMEAVRAVFKLRLACPSVPVPASYERTVRALGITDSGLSPRVLALSSMLAFDHPPKTVSASCSGASAIDRRGACALSRAQPASRAGAARTRFQ